MSMSKADDLGAIKDLEKALFRIKRAGLRIGVLTYLEKERGSIRKAIKFLADNVPKIKITECKKCGGDGSVLNKSPGSRETPWLIGLCPECLGTGLIKRRRR